MICPHCSKGWNGPEMCWACAGTGWEMSVEVAALLMSQAAKITRLELELRRATPPNYQERIRPGVPLLRLMQNGPDI